MSFMCILKTKNYHSKFIIFSSIAFVIAETILSINSPIFASQTSTSIPIVENTTENINYHARGIRAFRAGRYHEAVRLLNNALRHEKENPVLILNLASAYYKNKHYKNSYFYYYKLIEQPKYKSIAYYQLGLVSLKLQRYTKSEYWFKKSLSATSDPKLIKLSTIALGRIERSKEAQQEKYLKKKWRATVSVSTGYDDYVSFFSFDVDKIEQRKDSFTANMATVSGHLLGDSKAGAYAMLSNTNRTYNVETNFNYNIAQAKLAYDQRIGNFFNRLYTQYENIDLANADYQSIKRAGLSSQTSLNNKKWLRVNFQYSQYSSEASTYDYLEGNKHLFYIEIRKKNADDNYKLRYQVDSNHREDQKITGQYFDASPLRRTLSTRIRLYSSSHWSISTATSFRKSIYDKKNEILVAGKYRVQRRKDDRITISLTSNIEFGRYSFIRLSYLYMKNQSNIPKYTYNRNVLMLSVALSY